MADSDKLAATPKKIFDISVAPTTSLAPGSKTMIVGHGPVMQHPPSEETPESEAKAPEVVQGVVHELKLVPPSEGALMNQAQTQPETSAMDLSKTVKEEKVAQVEMVADVPEIQAQPAEPLASKANAVVEPGSIASTPEEKVKQDQATEEAMVAHQAEVIELATNQTLFLPINTVEKRRNKRVAIIGIVVCVILALALVDVALDAGLISNGLNLPHSHIFTLQP